MPRELEDIELRSEEVRDILTDVPHWLIMWGNSLFLFLILLLLGFAWVIRYPEIVDAQARITTETPPYYVINKISGRIEKLNKDSVVNEGAFLLEVQSPANQENIVVLERNIKMAKEIVSKRSAYKLLEEQNLVLGDAQSEYSRLVSTMKAYQNFLKDPYYSNKISNLRSQIKNYKRYDGVYAAEQGISQSDLDLAMEKLRMHRRLFKEELISRSELIEKEQQYKQLEIRFESSKRSDIQNDITITDYERQIKDLQFEQREKNRQLETEIHQSVLNLENLVANWNETYTIDAPISGKLSFFSRMKEQQFVSAGDTLFAIVPNDNQYLAELNIPSQKFGKVKTGQRVQIQLENYPTEEYGSLVGEIKELTNLQRRNRYFATVELPDTLLTTYRKTIEYKPNMQGQANIITEDLNLLQRMFHKFFKLKNK